MGAMTDTRLNLCPPRRRQGKVNDMADTRLNPCPLCRGEARMLDSHGELWWWAYCGECGMCAPGQGTADEAIECWNKVGDALRQECARLLSEREVEHTAALDALKGDLAEAARLLRECKRLIIPNTTNYPLDIFLARLDGDRTKGLS